MDLNKYELIVFDVDGTLYYQRKLRIIMAWRLFSYYVLHPHKYKDLLIIKKFREIREKAENTDALYEDTALKMGVSADRVESVIRKWIYENPMDAVKASRDENLLKIIEKLQDSNRVKVAIWSDYEADDKLKALGLECKYVYTAEQERVGELKPSPKGLKLIMADLSISPEKTIMIGDRMEKDGDAAIAAGCDYIILSKKKSRRYNQYNSLCF